MQTDHGLGKFINQKANKQTFFVYDLYRKTKKLECCFMYLQIHRNVARWKFKQKLSNRTKVFIHNCTKKMLKVIREKVKLIPKL